jgi:hypothetical protein
MRIAAAALVAGAVLGAVTGAIGRWTELTTLTTERPPLLSESPSLRLMLLMGTLVLAFGWLWLLRRGSSWTGLAAFALGLVAATGIGYDAVAPHPSSAFAGVIAFGPAVVVGSLALAVARAVRGIAAAR